MIPKLIVVKLRFEIINDYIFLKLLIKTLSTLNQKKDSLIAYSWKKYMEENGQNPERLVLMPMVKASVLAFNATSQVVQGKKKYQKISD